MAAVAFVDSIQPSRSLMRVSGLTSDSLSRDPRAAKNLYRRRRLVVAMLATSVLLVAGIVLGRLGTGPLASPHAFGSGLIATHTYVVHAGETDWSIARSVQPNGDVRPLVMYISNQHAGRMLQVGDVLSLP